MKYLLLLLMITTPSFAEAVDHSITMGQVTFEAIGSPGFLRINGESGELVGKVKELDGKASGTFFIKVDTFKTGMSLRDRHMKEKYMLTEKHPHATLVLSPTTLTSEFPWDGTLTLKGVTKPVKGTGKMAKAGKGRTVEAHFKINLKDFEVDIPSYLGISVAETVNLSVSVKVN